MDYLNNDCAPDIMRFFSAKLGGRKTGCYYIFLLGIGEENLPLFSEQQINFIKYVSSMLPLVRRHEYEIIKLLLDGSINEAQIYDFFKRDEEYYHEEEVEHAIRFMIKNKAISKIDGMLSLNVSVDDQLREYLDDLLEYGLVRYDSEYMYHEKFVLWNNYRVDQV